MITGGIFVSYAVNNALGTAGTWRGMFGLVPAAVLLAGMSFSLESPRWLIGQRRREEAREVLERTRDAGTDVEGEIRGIESQEKEEERAGYRDLLSPRLRPATTVGVGTALVNQLVGVNAVIHYVPTILSDAGFGDSAALLATFGVGLVNMVLTAIALLTIDRVGRRPLLLVGTAGVTLSLFVLGLATSCRASRAERGTS